MIKPDTRVLVKVGVKRGSHLPVLMKLFGITNGPIIELGSGTFSTPYLHWACFPNKRPLLTLEDHKDWFDSYMGQFKSDYHEIKFVEDWNAIDLSTPWSIAFVDHDNQQGRKRYQDVSRLTHADYVVCHDAENYSNHKYGYFHNYREFKYRWKYTACYPYTMVFSNKHNLKDFTI